MTAEKVLEVIETYRKFFIDRSVGKADFDEDELLSNPMVGFAHCHAMLDKVAK